MPQHPFDTLRRASTSQLPSNPYDKEQESSDSEDDAAAVLYEYKEQAEKNNIYIEMSDSDCSTTAIEEMLDADLTDSECEEYSAPVDLSWQDSLCCAPLPFTAYRSQSEVEEYLRDLDDLWSDCDTPLARDCAGTGWLYDPAQRGRGPVTMSYRAQSVIETDMSILTKIEVEKYKSQVDPPCLRIYSHGTN